MVIACRNGSPVWNGSSDFYFEDQYLYFASQIGLDSVTMYGVGERVGDLTLSPGKYAMWNRDQGSISMAFFPSIGSYSRPRIQTIFSAEQTRTGVVLRIFCVMLFSLYCVGVVLLILCRCCSSWGKCVRNPSFFPSKRLLCTMVWRFFPQQVRR